MRLTDLRTEVKNITDYAPELAAYKDQVDRLINAAYYAIWRMRRWTFAQERSELPLYPDINSARTGVTVNTDDGRRLVTFSGPVEFFVSNRDNVEGNVIQLKGREYTILKVESNTQLVLVEPVRHAKDASGSSPASIAGQTDWIVKFRFYRLPEDCIELLYLGHRDVPATSGGPPAYGKAPGLSARREETLNLREDYTNSYAECYIPTPPINVPPADKLGVTWQVGGSASAGTFARNKYYEFCWAVQAPDGSVGPLSLPTISRVPGDGDVDFYKGVFAFLTHDDQPFAARAPAYASRGFPEPLEGMRKKLYYNANFNNTTGQRVGLPLWRVITFGHDGTGANLDYINDPIIADDTAATVDVKWVNGLYPGNPRYIEYDGQYLRVRPYPRVDAFDYEYTYTATLNTAADRPADYFRRMEMRYYRKPNPLLTDTDGPDMPWEFHHLIVYQALFDVYTKAGNLQLAQVYRQKIDKEVKVLERRYLDRIDVGFQRGQFGRQMDGWMFDPTSLRRLN